MNIGDYWMRIEKILLVVVTHDQIIVVVLVEETLHIVVIANGVIGNRELLKQDLVQNLMNINVVKILIIDAVGKKILQIHKHHLLQDPTNHNVRQDLRDLQEFKVE